MSKVVLFLAVVGAVLAVAFGAGCGGGCVVDTDCNGSVCQSCMGGKCGSGCSAQCSLDTDCRDLNCRYCYDGICGNSPNRQCNQTCQVNTDCYQLGDCAICSGNKCTAGCGQLCKNSTECVGTTCHACILGKCAKDSAQCNQQCTTNLDCFQGSYCSLCIQGNCGAGCGQSCSADSQCIGVNCGYCTNGFCRPEPAGRTCGESCVVDSDCNGTPGSCNQCYLGKCGSVCGKDCKQSTDCVTHGCGICSVVNGTCGYV